MKYGVLFLRLVMAALVLGLLSCGSPNRDNPSDPGIGDNTPSIELIATLPVDLTIAPGTQFLAEVRYSITGEGIKTPVTGTMNLVGERARAVVRGVTDGSARRVHVEAFDRNRIRTFAATDTVDIENGVPSVLFLPLLRLTGKVELSSVLPPEIVSLSVLVVADADTLLFEYEIEEPRLQELLDQIPTGTGVRLLIRGRDADDQVVVSEDARTDVRDDLLAHVSLPIVTGAVSITANFPDYVPMVEVDRFGDETATFYRRSDNSDLPEPNESIDFDRLFLHQGLGPNQELIQFYNFDVRSKIPANIYVIVDRRGDRVERQLPIFEEIPGDVGYNDMRQVIEVRVIDSDYQPNSLTSLADIQAAGVETTVTEQIMNCVMVPDGSTAALRFDPTDAVGLHDGWYRDQVVRYLLFENSDSRSTAEFGGEEISAPVMYAFFDNDRDPSDGFAKEGGSTHNVVTRLPEQEGYSPLWALRVFKLSVFDRVLSVGSAQDNDREDNILIQPTVLIVNAPVVGVGSPGGG